MMDDAVVEAVGAAVDEAMNKADKVVEEVE